MVCRKHTLALVSLVLKVYKQLVPLTIPLLRFHICLLYMCFDSERLVSLVGEILSTAIVKCHLSGYVNRENKHRDEVFMLSRYVFVSVADRC